MRGQNRHIFFIFFSENICIYKGAKIIIYPKILFGKNLEGARMLNTYSIIIIKCLKFLINLLVFKTPPSGCHIVQSGCFEFVCISCILITLPNEC
jgi:hypothetical protein